MISTFLVRVRGLKTVYAGTPGGIGYFIRHSQQTFKVVDMWTGLLVLGIFGYMLNVAFRLVEKRVLRWHQRMNKQIQGEK